MRALFHTLVFCSFGLLAQGQNIVYAEHYIDTDPGFGQALPVAITPGADVTASFVADLSAVSEGMHSLFVRTLDDNGHWSLTARTPFYRAPNVPQPNNIVYAEYFFDTDPGFGMGTSLGITPGTDVAGTFTVSTSGLALGQHLFFVRSRDEAGHWSITARDTVEIIEDVITCTLPPVEYDYCYGDDGDLQMLYEAYVGESMSVTITGTTETNYDYLIIYDGTSTSDPVLYNASGDHTGQTFTSTSGSLLLQITSDGTVSCEAGSSCCSSGITVAVSCGDLATVTGIADAAPDEDTAMQLYPNPTNGEFTIAGTKANHTIEVYNNMGQLLLHQNAQQQRTSVNLQQQAPGIYHVHVIGDTEVTQFKLIKQ